MPRLSLAAAPINSSTILKALAGIIAAAVLSVTSWLLISQIGSQVAQAKTASVIQNIASNVRRIEQRDGKVGDAIVGINLTAQRLTDMIDRHDTDIKTLQSDVKQLQRSRSRR